MRESISFPRTLSGFSFEFFSHTFFSFFFFSLFAGEHTRITARKKRRREVDLTGRFPPDPRPPLQGRLETDGWIYSRRPPPHIEIEPSQSLHFISPFFFPPRFPPKSARSISVWREEGLSQPGIWAYLLQENSKIRLLGKSHK